MAGFHQMVDQMVDHFYFVRLGSHHYPGKMDAQKIFFFTKLTRFRHSPPSNVFLGMEHAIDHRQLAKQNFHGWQR
jgi:hypothetical protein